MPDTELSVVGERVAKETPIVGRTREGYRFVQSLSINNGVYTVAEIARCGIEIDATEIIVNGIELMTVLRNGLGCTEIERTAVGRENGKGLINRVLLEKGRKQ